MKPTDIVSKLVNFLQMHTSAWKLKYFSWDSKLYVNCKVSTKRQEKKIQHAVKILSSSPFFLPYVPLPFLDFGHVTDFVHFFTFLILSCYIIPMLSVCSDFSPHLKWMPIPWKWPTGPTRASVQFSFHISPSASGRSASVMMVTLFPKNPKHSASETLYICFLAERLT
jgi:hypothetical protein